MFASVGADGSVRMFDLRHLEHSTIIYEDPMHTPLLRYFSTMDRFSIGREFLVNFFKERESDYRSVLLIGGAYTHRRSCYRDLGDLGPP